MSSEIAATVNVAQDSKSMKRPNARLQRGLILVLVALALVAAVAAASFYMRQEEARVYRAARIANVTVGDLALTGLTVAEAETALAQHYAALSDTQVNLSLGAESWQFSAAELGIAVDEAATAGAAYDALRSEVASGVVITTTLAPILSHNDAAVRQVLAVIESAVAIAPIDAKLTVSRSEVAVSAAHDGQRLDVEATLKNIAASTAALPFTAARALTATVAPALRESDMLAATTMAATLAGEPITLSARKPNGEAVSWVLSSEDLRLMLVVSSDVAGKPQIASTLNSELLIPFVAAQGAALRLEPIDATMALPDYATSVEMTPDVSGHELDVAATVARLQQAAAGAERTVTAVLREVTASVTASQLQPVKDRMDRLMKDGITLSDGGKTYTISGANVVLKLYLERTEGANPPYRATASDEGVQRLARLVATNLNIPAQDATYRLVNGVVKLVKQPAEGYAIDSEATGANIRAALLNGNTSATLVGGPTQPSFSDTSITAIATPDTLGTSGTFYGYSSPERNWNVTLGAEKLDGWFVPPGEVFSINDALGAMTLDAGFKMGWGIIARNGNATTIPSEAGGICQVSTTLFQPVFWAGLPIVERHNHSYWIATYGQGVGGLKGLDATINAPWSDFKFKNTTGNWLLIRAIGDTKNLTVSIKGTDPNWTVQVADPVITNVVKTSTKMQYEKSAALPEGRTVKVETAQDGFDVDIHRKVLAADGTLISSWHAKAHYLPAQNVTVVGTGTAPTQ